ncbi:MAG: NAD(P)-dependent glycerol-3-phosphate dehydrogenase [Candidatus Omnitrophica bacterium]|nr:NAD(P)-dependent glycerol-3-phosphate dehydrogenase [Candidatus Omnitrophota bacterium]
MIKIDEIKNICVIGDGGWGTTLTVLLAKKGFNVTVWGAFPEYLEILKSSHENAKFLPGVRIPDSVKFTASLQEALKGNDIVVLAVPSQYMRGVLTMLKMEDLSDRIFVSVTKGIENDTLKRMSEVVSEVLGERKLVALSGPTIALEVANGSPSTAVAASRDLDLAVMVQDIFITDRFRIYASYDLIGVEVGGSLKNIIAIAAGALDAMGFGTNAKAALLTRGLVEMVRLGVAMGGRAETFYGLSGLGDLMTTCISQYSRNRWLGEEIGKGKPLKDILKETDMVVEGVVTAKSAFDLAKRYEVDMPITCEIYKVLYENKDPKKAVHDLMTRPSKIE